MKEIINDSGKFNDLSTIFKQILLKQADHDEFVRRSKNEIELQNQIIRFIKIAFFLEESGDIKSIYSALHQVSLRLNLQFVFHLENGGSEEIKNNMHINAIIINIFRRDNEGKQEFFFLYHENYSVFNESNLNISNNIFWNSGNERAFSELNDKIYKYIRNILRKNALSDEEKFIIFEAIQSLKQVNPVDDEFKEILQLIN